jgi:hypothetical protein
MFIIEDFQSFINEAEGYNGEGIFTVATLSQRNLFDCEISGQISDGAWENTKPYDHWKPWTSEVKVGSNIGRDFPVKKDGYNLTSLIQYVGARMLAFGATGAAGWDIANYTDEQYTIENFFSANSIADLERMCITETFEQHFEKFIEKNQKDSYWKKYADQAQKNKKRLEDVWNVIKSGRYGIRQLKTDLNEISKAMKIYNRK